MKAKIYLIIAMTVTIVSCQKGTDDINENQNSGSDDNPLSNQDWIIPYSEVYDGGPGKDGIPALTEPEFTSASEATYLSDEDLVLGFKHGNQIRAYPHSILDWHEIINDDIGDVSMAVIYCPLTGTGIGWNRVLNEGKTTFGVSGLLYNSNIIPYDRLTNSNWSQMLLKSVNGELMERESDNFFLLETSWKTWKAMYPDTKVISESTGYSRNYSVYPYGNYKTSNSLLFPVANFNDQLPKKERVLGVLIADQVKAYSIEEFSNSITIFNDQLGGTNLVLAGSKSNNFIVAYDRVLSDGTSLEFTAVQNEFPAIMKDDEGNKWDAFGVAISGSREGSKLNTVTQMMGYWFAWAAFYPDIQNYWDTDSSFGSSDQ